MSIDYCTKIYYGVELSMDEAKTISDKLWDDWCHYVDAYNSWPVVFGYTLRSIPEGGLTEFRTPKISAEQDFKLRKALHEAMINREPKFYLGCCID